MTPPRSLSLTILGGLLAAGLLVTLLVPLLALAFTSSGESLRHGLGHPAFLPALGLSLRTTLLSLVIVVVTGTPLAWWLASTPRRIARVTEVLVELPLVMPPAVIGVALLQTFGRQGLLGPLFGAAGLQIPFSTVAVVLAQVVVAAPFYVQAAANAFRKVDPDLITVARTLGANPGVAFVRVALPVAFPGLMVGASLAWARSLGEFGATLLFAGNLGGKTQTMPLAIYTVLQSDLRLAVSFSVVLVLVAGGLLLALRLVTRAGRPS